MRILRDENLDWRLKRSLPGHHVESVQKNGWAGIKNGDLLARADHDFDGFITMDGNIEFQQNYGRLRLAIVALRAPSNRLRHTEPLMPCVLGLLAGVKAGTITVVQ
jgi:hypothetical protein